MGLQGHSFTCQVPQAAIGSPGEPPLWGAGVAGVGAGGASASHPSTDAPAFPPSHGHAGSAWCSADTQGSSDLGAEAVVAPLSQGTRPRFSGVSWTPRPGRRRAEGRVYVLDFPSRLMPSSQVPGDTARPFSFSWLLPGPSHGLVHPGSSMHGHWSWAQTSRQLVWAKSNQEEMALMTLRNSRAT